MRFRFYEGTCRTRVGVRGISNRLFVTRIMAMKTFAIREDPSIIVPCVLVTRSPVYAVDLYEERGYRIASELAYRHYPALSIEY
jgi:hypothetical protein